MRQTRCHVYYFIAPDTVYYILIWIDHKFLPVSDHIGGNQTRQLEKFQEKAQHQLQEYVVTSYPAQADRLCKLLLRLPALRLLNPTIMEELFFAGLIGSVQIDSIIPYILRMETAEYTMAAAMNSVGITTAGGHPEDSMSPVSMTTTDHISNIVTNVMPQ